MVPASASVVVVVIVPIAVRRVSTVPWWIVSVLAVPFAIVGLEEVCCMRPSLPCWRVRVRWRGAPLSDVAAPVSLVFVSAHTLALVPGGCFRLQADSRFCEQQRISLVVYW